MDSNKDEALRCISMAKEAIAAGNKKRALKFIGIASRLNSDLQVDGLIEACEKLNSTSLKSPTKGKSIDANETSSSRQDEFSNGRRSYTEEHAQVIRQIKKNNDYYTVLGLEKSCSIEEIRKAYKKLSLKVHPDKNKAPGSEEAFKKVCKAFKFLSDESSRRQYDQTGLVEDFEYNQQNHVRRRRARTQNPSMMMNLTQMKYSGPSSGRGTCFDLPMYTGLVQVLLRERIIRKQDLILWFFFRYTLHCYFLACLSAIL